jgi:hypothetical protein
MVSLASWIVRTIAISDRTSLYADIVVSITSFIFFAIFLMEKNSLQLFEVFYQHNSGVKSRDAKSFSSSNMGSFSWDEVERDSDSSNFTGYGDRNSLRPSLTMQHVVGSGGGGGGSGTSAGDAVGQESAVGGRRGGSSPNASGGQPSNARRSSGTNGGSMGGRDHRASVEECGPTTFRDSGSSMLSETRVSVDQSRYTAGGLNDSLYQDRDGEFNDSEHDLESVASVLGLEPRDSQFSGRESYASTTSISSSSSAQMNPIIFNAGGTSTLTRVMSLRGVPESSTSNSTSVVEEQAL